MNDHPLTDEECYKLCNTFGLDHVFDNMRRAYDKQLTEVLEWLDENLSEYTDHSYLGDCHPLHRLDTDLKKAMRPTQETHD